LKVSSTSLDRRRRTDPGVDDVDMSSIADRSDTQYGNRTNSSFQDSAPVRSSTPQVRVDLQTAINARPECMQMNLKTSPASSDRPDCTSRTMQSEQTSTSIHFDREEPCKSSQIYNTETHIPQYLTNPHCQSRSTRPGRSDKSACSALCTLRKSGRSRSNRGGRLLPVR